MDDKRRFLNHLRSYQYQMLMCQVKYCQSLNYHTSDGKVIWPADLGEQEILEKLLELNLDRAWGELLASPESQEWLEEMAEETLADVRAGRTEPLDVERM